MLRELMFTWGPWFYNKGMSIYDLVLRIYKVVYNEITVSKEWLFLEGVPIPIASELFPVQDNSVLRWRATVHPARFSGAPEGAFKHLGYLMFTVNIPGQAPIDLTEWINDVRWRGTTEPTPADCFLLWCCERRLPLFQHLKDAKVTFVDEMGEEFVEELKAEIHHICNVLPHLSASHESQ
jgi:hypothetical protein